MNYYLQSPISTACTTYECKSSNLQACMGSIWDSTLYQSNVATFTSNPQTARPRWNSIIPLPIRLSQTRHVWHRSNETLKNALLHPWLPRSFLLRLGYGEMYSFLMD